VKTKEILDEEKKIEEGETRKNQNERETRTPPNGQKKERKTTGHKKKKKNDGDGKRREKKNQRSKTNGKPRQKKKRKTIWRHKTNGTKTKKTHHNVIRIILRQANVLIGRTKFSVLIKSGCVSSSLNGNGPEKRKCTWKQKHLDRTHEGRGYFRNRKKNKLEEIFRSLILLGRDIDNR